ncbi:hypothetical protein MKW98_008788 [Papaver atlanticum]|uniref:Uncharacterized protein n=1 Tax=Papaver atlanticum TaxID=357466 RepID=A0AAD4XTF7_9MAGN|nr:hypothetical protein MKW98_008788 [Papaver atlanticum]
MEIKQKQVVVRGLPRFLDQTQQLEAVGANNEANKKLEMDTKQRETQLQELRIRYYARRNSLTETEKEKIREYKRIAYLKRKSTTASEGSSDQVAVMKSGKEHIYILLLIFFSPTC